MRASDHSGDAVAFTPGSGPGAWVPTAPAFRPALDPGWGHVTPYLLRSGSQLRPGPPPALTSAAYARDLDEIRQVGAATSTTRTPEQTDLARFWVSTAPQIWNQAAQQLAIAHDVGVRQAARVFALLNAAGADAFIAAWDAKFTYGQWRPVTAIQATADPAWTPLLVTPPFPDYPAGHTTYAGAAETVLTGLLGARPGPFTLRSATAPGVELAYTSFSDVAAGVVDARVWGGIHWRTSAEAGRALGRRIGRYGLTHARSIEGRCARGGQGGQRPEGDAPAPLDGLSRRPRKPVERPAAVILLAALQAVEVGVDLLHGEQSTAAAVGPLGEGQRAEALVLGAALDGQRAVRVDP